MVRKAAALPPIPPGNITDMPALSPDEKIAALAELEKATLKELAPLLNDVATKVVFGEGDANAELMFVGEGPGIEEDKTGRPFVGRSGQLLDKQIAAMGLTRGQVFIANIVKLRAAEWDEASERLKDRPPTPEEVAKNIHVLHRQIEIIRPKVIVTLGAPAIKWLTHETQGVMTIRGTWKNYRGIAVMPTYHPSFLLRAYTEENRGKVWSDLKQVMAKLGLKVKK